MKRLLYFTAIIFILGFVSLQTSCDDHEAVDTNIHVGDVVFSDHSTMRYEQFVLDSFTQMTRNPIGVVFAEPNGRHKALVVLLAEVPAEATVFTDSLSSLGTSTSIDSCYGKSNTIAMQSSKLSPLADYVFRMEDGTSAFIPSVAEMRLLVSSLSVVNPILHDLGGETVSTSSDCWYWTSTEVDGNDANQAWTVSSTNGSIQPSPKDEHHRCRAVIELND